MFRSDDTDQPPLYAAAVPAGFPSPADDHLEGRLDVQELLVRRPAATFFARASGDSMKDAGILDGDLLVVDRSVPVRDGDVVVATLEGGLTVKFLRKREAGWALVPANHAFEAIPIDPDEGVQVWGVVTFAITELCPR